MAIIGIPSTRVSDYFVRQVLLDQTQADQRAIFAISTQVSTGRRYQLPSESPVASMQVMGLQGLLEQKLQMMSNVRTSQSFLSATDTAMSQIASILSDARANALGAIGTTASQTERRAAVQQIQQAIGQLFDSGNQLFRGRHLFGGSDTIERPFSIENGNFIRYTGDERKIETYADLGLLVSSNLQGNEVYGAISDPVRGSIDVNPVAQFDTKLADLFDGRGVPLGSIEIRDGVTGAASIIDLSGATTIGDLLSLIHDSPPTGTRIDGEITPTGFTLQMPGGNLQIRDIGNGTTAKVLGIRNEIGAGAFPLASANLSPRVTLTTSLDDILGSRARTVLRLAEPDNDMIFTADQNGVDQNGVAIVLANDVTAGSESAVYDAVGKTLTLHMQNGFSEARKVVQAVNDAHAAGTVPFTAQVDPLDATLGGAGFVDNTKVLSNLATANGSGADLDRASGLQIVNGGATHVIDVSNSVTVEDLLNTLNDAGAGLLAEINERGTGINIRSRLSGSDFGIGENGGTTASQLGLRTSTRETELADLNFGRGVGSYEGLGNTAFVRVAFPGDDNDLSFRSTRAGSAYNDFTITIDNVVGPGAETIAVDPVAKTINVAVVPGSTTAQDIVTIANQNATLKDLFAVALAGDDGASNTGSGVLAPVALAVPVVATTAGGDENIDFVIHRADGVAFSVSVRGMKTIGEVIDGINNNPVNLDPTLGSGTPLLAQVAEFGNGIELIDNSIGAQPFSISRTVLSTAAVDLGLVPVGKQFQSTTTAGAHSQTTLPTVGSSLVVAGQAFSDLLDGVIVEVVDSLLGAGNETIAYDSVARKLTFDITAGVTTVADLRNLSRRNPPPDPVAASLFDITLASADGTGLVQLTVPGGEPTLTGGAANHLQGADTAVTETEGLFTALLRLGNGLTSNDMWEIERSVKILDEYMTNMNFSRAELGARQQGLDVMQARLDQEEVELKSVISQEYEVDLVEAVSNLTARQTAYEASLKSIATISKMTLLDYL